MNALGAIEIEQSVLGSFIIDESLGDRLDDLNESTFTYEYHKYIFTVMKDLKKSKITLDIPSIKTKLNELGVNVEVSYLTDLTIGCFTYSIDKHIEILKEKELRRNILKTCQKLLENISIGENIDSCIYGFESTMKYILDGKEQNNDSVENISSRVLDFLESENEVGFKFGIEILDETIGGLFKGELTTIGARSGCGKTALALQIMLNCIEQGKRVLFISREMSSEQVFMRNLCKKTGVDTKKMKYKDINENEWRLIINTMAELSKDNLIYINDKVSTIGEIKKRLRQIKPDLLIVDYLQLLTPPKSMQNREREVASISRDLKSITLDFNIPIIQLSQLNDEMKDFRPWGERPMRDSKAIFHDSNNVIYIHEPIGHDLEKAVKDIGVSMEKVKSAKQKGVNLVDLIVAKCRDGEKKFKHYYYEGPRLHFANIVY